MPNTDDTIIRFLASDTLKRLEMIKDSPEAEYLRAWMGDEAFEEYRGLATKLDITHLAGPASPNIIFVPGVMGSLLTSRGLGGVWWVDVRSRKHLNDLRLAPDGLTDANPSHDVASFAVDVSYESFLAAVLSRDDFGHIAFHYDWRKSLYGSTERLREVILAAHAENERRPVHVVAHSMGGLLVRATLMRNPELWQCVDKVVFLGTPHYGSPAIASYLKNHLWGFDLMLVLGRYLDRTTFRSLWGVLSLLPAPVGVYPDTRDEPGGKRLNRSYPHPCANFDLYDATAWKIDLSQEKQGHLQAVLDAAADFHRELFAWHRNLDQEFRDRMAVIAGVGYRTLFRLAYRRGGGFLWRAMDRVTDRNTGNPHREGDGRVPLASAALEWVKETRYTRTEHSKIPTAPAVYDDVFRFLSGVPMQLPETPKEAIQGHLGDSSEISETPALAQAATQPQVASEDPGYLQLREPEPDAIAEIELALEEGRLPSFNRVRLL